MEFYYCQGIAYVYVVVNLLIIYYYIAFSKIVMVPCFFYLWSSPCFFYLWSSMGDAEQGS